MVSAILMFSRFFKAVKIAAKEESFLAIASSAVLLVLIGTVTYTVTQGWNLVDGFYFAVATLTTSSIADPDLTLNDSGIKIFTAFYVLTGIGILVEVARQIGSGFVKLRQTDSGEKQSDARSLD